MKRGVKPGEYILFLNESTYGITRRGYTAICQYIRSDSVGNKRVGTNKFGGMEMEYCVPFSLNLITSEFSEFRIHTED